MYTRRRVLKCQMTYLENTMTHLSHMIVLQWQIKMALNWNFRAKIFACRDTSPNAQKAVLYNGNEPLRQFHLADLQPYCQSIGVMATNIYQFYRVNTLVSDFASFEDLTRSRFSKQKFSNHLNYLPIEN